MTIYIVIAISYWFAALREATTSSRLTTLQWAVIATFAALAGLRFETGYDWMAYEAYFEDIPTLSDIIAEQDISMFGTMEPGFGVLNSAIKSLGLPIQALIVVASIFNSWVLFNFLRKYSFHVIYCLAIYFCWVYLRIQMGAIRQSLCCSCLILAIDSLLERRIAKYYLCVALASCFHFSGILFLFLGPVLAHRIPQRIVWTSIVSGVLVVIAKINLLGIFSILLHAISIGFVQQKVDYYLAGGFSSPPPIHLIYAAGNLALLTTYRQWMKKDDDRLDHVFFNIAFLVVCLQLFAWQLPWLWNRLFYTAIVPQVCAVSRMIANSDLSARLMTVAFSAVVSVAVLLHFITRPEKALPYVPYQSYVMHVVTGDHGDGRERMEDYNRAVFFMKQR